MGGRGSGSGMTRGSSANPGAGNGGVRTLSGHPTQQTVLNAIENAEFVPNGFGGYSAGVRFNDTYNRESMDGTIESRTTTIEIRTTIHQRSYDGKWEISGTGSALDTKGFSSRSTAERNARKAMANIATREGGFGRTLTRAGRWRR